MRDPKERLRDILDAVARIRQYAARGRAAYESDELIQVWIIHHIQILGEAAAQLGREFHEEHSVLPWPQVVAMRNVLVQDYFGVDLDGIWNVVEHDLPALQAEVERLLATLENSNE